MNRHTPPLTVTPATPVPLENPSRRMNRHTLFKRRSWITRPSWLTLAAVIIWLVPAVIMFLSLLVLAWALTRPGARFGPQDGTWLRSQINHDLYVGVDPNYPPFAEWTPDEIAGIEPDIAREIGQRLGVKASILIMGYDSLYDSLYTGQVDMVISGLKVDPGRGEWVYYSQPYFDAGQILVSRADSPIESIRQLNGKTVAVEMASAGDLAALRWKRRLHSLDITRHMLPTEAMQAVQTGQAEAALVDVVSARLYLKEHPDLTMAEKTTVPENFVIVMRRGNFRLTEEVERALAEMIKDGTLDKIITRWL